MLAAILNVNIWRTGTKFSFSSPWRRDCSGRKLTHLLSVLCNTQHANPKEENMKTDFRFKNANAARCFCVGQKSLGTQEEGML